MPSRARRPLPSAAAVPPQHHRLPVTSQVIAIGVALSAVLYFVSSPPPAPSPPLLPRPPPPPVSSAVADRVVHKAAELTAAGNPTEAVRRLSLLLSRAPPDWIQKILFEMADAYSALSRPADVQDSLEGAVAAAEMADQPSDLAEALYALCKFRMQTKAPRTGTIAYLRRAVEANPAHDNALHWLGHQLSRSPTMYEDAGMFLSRVRLNRLTDSHPLDTIMLLGQARERAGNLSAAAAAFREAVTIFRAMHSNDPPEDRLRYRYALSHFQLVRALLADGKVREAFEVAMSAHASFPETYHVHVGLSLAFDAAGRPADALAVIQAAADGMEEWQEEWRTMPDRVLGATLAWLLERWSRLPQASMTPEQASAQLAAKGAATVAAERPESNGDWPSEIYTRWESPRCNSKCRRRRC